MAQSDPVAPRALFVLRGGNGDPVTTSATGPVTAPLPVTEAVTLPVQPSGVTGNPEDATGCEPGAEVTPLPVPLSPVERTRLAVAHWAGIAVNGAGQLWLHPGRLGHTLYHGKPSSMAEHVAYVKSRAWVPPELDGKLAAFIAGAGIVFYSIAALAQIPLLILKAALDRMLRLTGLAVLLIALAVFVLPHI